MLTRCVKQGRTRVSNPSCARQECLPPEVERSMKLIISRDSAKSARPVSVTMLQSESVDRDEILVEQELSDQDLENPAMERKDTVHTLYSSSRSEMLGRKPRSVRSEMRNTQEPGFYLSDTGRKGTLILHKLGACFAIPGLDYLKFRYGELLFKRSERSVKQ